MDNRKHIASGVKSIIIVLLTAISFFSTAQEYRINVRNLNLEEGFSSRNVHCLFQDHAGFLWIRTDHGLDRFDGTRVKHFSNRSAGLKQAETLVIQQDQQGLLWMNYHFAPMHTEYLGVDIFDPVTGKSSSLSQHLKDSLPISHQSISYLKEHLGTMLISTTLGEIYEIQDRKWLKKYQTPQAQPIISLHQGTDSSIWVNYANHISKIDRQGQLLQTIQKENTGLSLQFGFEHTPGQFHHGGSELSVDQESGETEFNTKYYINEERNQPVNTEAGLDVFAVNPQTRDQYWTHEDPISNNLLMSIYGPQGTLLAKVDLGCKLADAPYFDRQGNLWFFSESDLKKVSLKKSLFSKILFDHTSFFQIPYATRGITEDGKGNLLVNGLGYSWIVNLSTQEKQRLSPADKFNHPYASGNGDFLRLAFFREDNDHIWISEESFRLLRYQISTGNFEKYTYASALFDSLEQIGHLGNIPSLHWSMHLDKARKLWFGRRNGLSYLDERTKTINLLPNTGNMKPLEGAEIIDMHENDQGIWLATTKGVFLFDPYNNDIIRHYHSNDTAHYLPPVPFAHIYEDRENMFWLASKGDGLIRWDAKSGQVIDHFSKEDGLSSDMVYCVYEDHMNRLWMATDRGINRLNLDTREITSFQEEDGITHHEFNTISHYRGSDSTLYFGGLNGITHFDPKVFSPNEGRKGSSITITGVSKQNRQDGALTSVHAELLAQQSIQLNPDDLGLQIEFSYPDFEDSPEKRFAYKIEGLDNTWVPLSEPHLRLNALPYGQHNILIRAKASNQNWSTPLTLPVTVIKPYYLRLSFILLSLFLVIVVSGLSISWRIRKIKAREVKLQETVQSRTQTIENQKIELQAQTEELKKLDIAKSHFFVNVSHEFRTPLTLIKGSSEQLLKAQKTGEEGDQIRRIHGNSEKLIELTEQILDLSRLESGFIENHYTLISAMSWFKRVYANFESLARQQEIQYLHQNELHPDLLLSTDAEKLEKVMNNLISNAIRFTPKQGVVQLKTSIENQKLLIQVSDTGVGIKAEFLPYLFDRFFQVRSENVYLANKGTGIGLALTQELVKVMDGNITVESVEKSGTTFKVHLPLQETQMITTTGKISKSQSDVLVDVPQPSKGFYILLVEDNEEMQQYISELLKPHYQLKCANNGIEALNILSTSLPDLIVSDVMMPEMDGFTLVERLKADAHLSVVPVILLTALSDKKDRMQALRIGIDDYLTKPFSSEELLVRIKNLISNYQKRKQVHEEGLLDQDVVQFSTQAKWMQEFEENAIKQLGHHEFSLESLAADMSLSSRQLQRKVKVFTGLTFTEYAKELKLTLAREYLENRTFKNVAEVSQAVGIQSTKYFSRLFKERYGISPSSFF